MTSKFANVAKVLADFCVACVIVGPCTVFYWASTWTLMNVYVYPDDKNMTGVISFAIGYGVTPIFYLLQNVLKQRFKRHNIWSFLFVYHLYTYLFGFCIVNHWRGIWALLDHHFGLTWQSGLVTCCIGLGGLAAFRSLKMLLAPPTITVLDVDTAFFDCSTRFSANVSFSLNF